MHRSVNATVGIDGSRANVAYAMLLGDRGVCMPHFDQQEGMMAMPTVHALHQLHEALLRVSTQASRIVTTTRLAIFL